MDYRHGFLRLEYRDKPADDLPQKTLAEQDSRVGITSPIWIGSRGGATSGSMGWIHIAVVCGGDQAQRIYKVGGSVKGKLAAQESRLSGVRRL